MRNVSVSVNQSEVVVLLGPNGHGKSTLLKSICGLVDNTKGRITYRGRDINGMPAEKIVNMGITYVAENRELFPYMTVLDNLKLGAYSKNARADAKKNLERVFELFPRLMDRQKQFANKQGKTVFLVEQNIPQIAELADRIYVMEEGRISFEGSKNEALSSEHLKKIFLGM